jgi:transmembrane sensor
MIGAGPSTEPDPLYGEALAWLVRLTSGAATHADAEALAGWRAQSVAHEQAFVAAARFNGLLRQAAGEVAAERSAPAAPRRYAAMQFATRRRMVLGGAVAASAAAYYMATRPPLGLWPSVAELQAQYRTGTGERQNIALAPGVSIEMNTQTSLSIPAGGNAPLIRLIAGEAMVTAQRDAGAPVVVAAAAGRVSSSNATFDVRCDGANVQVTCVEGEVRIEHASDVVVLQSGQRSGYGDGVLHGAEQVDPARITAWRSGLLIFHGQSLSRVVAELNRYRHGRIILTNAALGRLPINGVFHLDRLDGVIDQIKALGASMMELPGGVVLLG